MTSLAFINSDWLKVIVIALSEGYEKCGKR